MSSDIACSGFGTRASLSLAVVGAPHKFEKAQTSEAEAVSPHRPCRFGHRPYPFRCPAVRLGAWLLQ